MNKEDLSIAELINQLKNDENIDICDEVSTTELEFNYYKIKKLRQRVVYYLLYFLLISGSLTCIGFMTRFAFHIKITTIVIVAILGISAIILYAAGSLKLAKTGIVLMAAIFFITLLYLVLERLGVIEILQDKEALRQSISQHGAFAVPIFIIIQFLQATILPIPSSATTIVGALLFGEFLGSVYSLIAIIPASILCFYLGRFAGYNIVVWIIGKDSLIKTLNMVRGKDKVVLTLMFILPLFPDDALCFVAGLSSMSALYFIIMITLSRAFQVFTTSYFTVGGLIPIDTPLGISVWVLIGLFTVLLFYICIKKGEKIERFIITKIFKKQMASNSFDFVDKVLVQIERNNIDKKQKLILKLKKQQRKKYINKVQSIQKDGKQ